MQVGLIGLPEVGKTTLFNALTRASAAVHAFGARSDEVNRGTVPVPDERFDFAVEACRPKKQVPATIDVTDGGARVEVGEHRDKFGTDFFAGVRNMDALVLVLRAFDSVSLPLPEGGINPVRDARTVFEELLLADLVVVEGRLARLEKSRQARKATTAEAVEAELLERIKAHLESLKPMRTLQLSADEERLMRSYAFVSGKPLVVVVNVNEGDLGSDAPGVAAVKEWADLQGGLEVIDLCAAVEMEIAQMEPAEEREFLSAVGVTEPARDRLVRAAYAALGYISFLTVGEDEVRSWTLRRGATALAAADRIHTDLARTFIRAEVMAFEDFRAAGGWDAARAAGKMRLESKEYVVKDGEIVHIRNSRG